MRRGTRVVVAARLLARLDFDDGRQRTSHAERRADGRGGGGQGRPEVGAGRQPEVGGGRQPEVDGSRPEVDGSRPEVDRGQLELDRGQLELDRGRREVGGGRREVGGGRHEVGRCEVVGGQLEVSGGRRQLAEEPVMCERIMYGHPLPVNRSNGRVREGTEGKTYRGRSQRT